MGGARHPTAMKDPAPKKREAVGEKKEKRKNGTRRGVRSARRLRRVRMLGHRRGRRHARRGRGLHRVHAHEPRCIIRAISARGPPATPEGDTRDGRRTGLVRLVRGARERRRVRRRL